jgi:hypothetical protein
MVVLDQNSARQIHAVVVAAARPHRIFLQLAPAGKRFPCVEDLGVGSLHKIHELGGERGDSRKALEVVQRDALRRQQSPCMSRYEEHGDARLDPASVLLVDADRDFGIELAERLDRQRNSGDHAALTGHERAARAAIRDDRRDGREIVERAVFLQRGAHRRGQSVLLERKAKTAAVVESRYGHRSNRARHGTSLSDRLQTLHAPASARGGKLGRSDRAG